MTTVDFHTGVADPIGLACRLLRRAYRQGIRVLVTAPAPVLMALDRELWVFEPREFVPHLRLTSGAPSALADRTPIWLTEGAIPTGGPAVLVNLGAAAPADPAAFERIVEIVSDAPDDAQAGRARWRAYKVRGLNVQHHPAASPARD